MNNKTIQEFLKLRAIASAICSINHRRIRQKLEDVLFVIVLVALGLFAVGIMTTDTTQDKLEQLEVEVRYELAKSHSRVMRKAKKRMAQIEAMYIDELVDLIWEDEKVCRERGE